MQHISNSRIKEIFSEAAELTPAERQRYLELACGADTELRGEVERLLAGSDDCGGILDASSVGEYLFGSLEPAHTFETGDHVGRFHIVRMIGRGGMGEVYEAEDKTFGGRVALKTLRADCLRRPEFAARFRREIRLARKVNHPNVCRILDVGTYQVAGDELAYLTMDLLEGETMAERLKNGPLSPGEAAPLFAQIASGLNALHESGVVHRDLKPGNVILVPSRGGPRCIITDFGLAQTSEGADNSRTGTECLTVAGQLLGTPVYMSPEQLTGNVVGPYSDVYALGIVMYEALCGKRPFESEQFVRSATQKLSTRPVAPSHIVPLDRRWDSLILQCLDPREAQRPRTPELLRQLHALSSPERRGRTIRNLRWSALYRPILYGVASLALLTASVPFAVRILPAAARNKLCETFPGQSAVCTLPADKGIAVLPFEIRGATDSDRAVATGAAQYVRESFARLVPNADTMCVHVRPDRRADGVQLIMDGQAEASREAITMRITVRHARAAAGASPGLLLRQVQFRVPMESARNLHTRALEEIASALELTYSPEKFRAWTASAPKFSDSFLLYLQGLGYLNTDNYDRAAQAFDAAITPARDFAFAPAHVGLGDTYRLMLSKTRDRAWERRARQAYERAVSFDKVYGFADARKRLGELELAFGNPDLAADHFSAALKFWPDDHLAMKSLALTYERSGKPDRAREVLRNAVKRSPNCWLTHNTIAEFDSRHARYTEAEKSMLEVIRIGPDNTSAYHNLAMIYIRAGRFDDAIDITTRAVAIKPAPFLYSTLGRALMYRGCYSDALVNLRKAVDLEPASYTGWSELSEGLNTSRPGTEEALKATIQAQKLTAQLLEKAPEFYYGHAQLAVQYARLGEKSLAAQEAYRSLELARDSHDIVLLAAKALELAGKRTEALSVLDRGFSTGLTVYEINSSRAFDGLRRDARFDAIRRRLNPDQVLDPGGLTPPSGRSCPASAVPGQGLTRA